MLAVAATLRTTGPAEVGSALGAWLAGVAAACEAPPAALGAMVAVDEPQAATSRAPTATRANRRLAPARGKDGSACM